MDYDDFLEDCHLAGFREITEMLDMRDYDIDKFLGAGTYGCAYLLDNGLALKITQQESEYQAAQAIVDGRVCHRMLPRIYDCWLWFKRGKLGVYVREELDDLVVHNREWFDHSTIELEEAVLMYAGHPNAEDLIVSYMTHYILNEPGHHHDEEIVEKIIEMELDLLEQGWALTHDLNIENWSVREDGEIVLRDVGGLRKL